MAQAGRPVTGQAARAQREDPRAEGAGTPIGPYDQMIAGHAQSRGLIVVTANTDEFRRVPGISVEDWTKADVSPRRTALRTRSRSTGRREVRSS